MGLKRFRGVIGVAVLAVAGLVGLVPEARSQALVINGETIADATLYAAAKKEGKLLIYGVIPSDTYDGLVQGFEKDTGIKVEIVRLPTQGLYSRAISEFAAGKLTADFIDLSEPPLLKDLMDKGILNKPHKVPSFDRLPADVKDPQGRWYAEIRQVQTIGVNTAVVKEADYPKSWTDLLDPKWKGGKIGMGTIDAGGAHFVLQSYLKQVIDKDFWPKLAAQQPRVYPSVAPAMTNLARGEVSIGLAAAGSILDQIDKGAPLKAIFPSEGTASFFVGGGITATAKNPNAAALFLNYFTSKRGGEAISPKGVFASHPDAPPPSAKGLTYPTLDKVWFMDVDRWMQTRESLMTEWRTTFGVK